MKAKKIILNSYPLNDREYQALLRLKENKKPFPTRIDLGFGLPIERKLVENGCIKRKGNVQKSTTWDGFSISYPELEITEKGLLSLRNWEIWYNN